MTHGGTLTCLAVFAKMMWDRAEIAHPVFAVILQEMLALLFFETLGLILTLCLVIDPMNITLLSFYPTPSYVALLFHQVTWLIVTYLRWINYSNANRQN